jgi:hypothetical protein
MPYCPHCGNEVDHAVDASPAAEAVSAEVRIAEINANRDVEVAKIQARETRAELETAEAIAETEADADVAVAEAQSEALAEVAAAVDDQADDDTGAPIVVDVPDAEDDAPDMPPPPEEEHHREPAKRNNNIFGF